jgi:hypothetical protein
MAIVCGTDFSSSAAEAATIAALLAARLEEPLFLLYALDELADFRVDAEAARAYESVFDLARRRLPVEADRLRAHGAKVEEVSVTGAPDEAADEDIGSSRCVRARDGCVGTHDSTVLRPQGGMRWMEPGRVGADRLSFSGS